ncbi:MAG: DUF2892 domain-containing protein [Bacteroidia bacterium]
MKKNMGYFDRVARILVAVTIITLYFTNLVSGTLAIVLLVVSGIFILTSFISFCPLYALFGFNSNSKKSANGNNI